ncbi:MAG: hypothetical protein JW390_10065 [Nitrosopumilus sp.]|nr:hypothetical protein [Candidatus Nitrosopumilus limneticus]
MVATGILFSSDPVISGFLFMYKSRKLIIITPSN